jgi:hypothetical protein
MLALKRLTSCWWQLPHMPATFWRFEALFPSALLRIRWAPWQLMQVGAFAFPPFA